jgi:chromosome partitioning protein
MGKVITVAHQKGGVGKSTIALNLAVELGKKYPLSVIDLDYQKSVSIFNENRKEAGLSPLNIVLVETQKELMNAIDDTDGILLIDSGGFDSDLNRIAILGADIIVTPLSNNLIEIYGLEAFKKILLDLKGARPDIKSHILLNNVNPQTTKSIEELKEYVKSNSQFFSMFETVLRRRVDFAKSFELGKSVVEIDSFSKASKELNALVSEIEEIL